VAGLPAAKVETRIVEDIEYFLVERYDRVHRKNAEGATTLDRLHQEDCCQAQGIVPETKYQKEGGPSLKQCFALLRDVSSAPVIDLSRLLDAVIFNYLVGNNDAHGKNFSLLYHGVGTASQEIRLAGMHCTFFRGNQFSSFLPARTAALEAKRSGSPGCTALFSREPVFLIPSGWDRSPGSQEIGLAGMHCTFFQGNQFSSFPLFHGRRWPHRTFLQ